MTGNSYSGHTNPSSSLFNNIGFVHDYQANMIHGRKVQYLKDIKEEWDLWQTSRFQKRDVRAKDFDTLYIKCLSDPNNLKLEFAVGSAALKMTNTTIQDIDIDGWGFGIYAHGKNCKIKKC